MARITSTINYYKNINLSDDYSNVCDAIDLANLQPFLVFTDTNISVITHNIESGSFRIRRTINDLSYINYIAILNNANDRSPIFAFITNLNYIADDVTEVLFNIDLFSTYCQTLDYQDCYIKRMTVNNDAKYMWLQEENLTAGDYVVNSTLEDYTVNWNFGFSAVTDSTGYPLNGKVYDNIFSVAEFKGYPDYGSVVEQLQYYNSHDKIDNVCDVLQYPRECGDSVGGNNIHRAVDIKYIDMPTNIDGYVPKNNKLFNFPYVRCLIVSSDGESLELKPELTTDNQGRIQYRKDVMVVPIEQIVVTVGNYSGYTASNNKLDRLFITGFPQVTWASDNYRAWVARNKPARDFENDVIKGEIAYGIASKNLIPTLIDTSQKLVNRYIEDQTAMITNDQTIHKGSNLGIDVATDTFGVISYVQTIKAKQAELIDNYFNAFGYAINKVSFFRPSRTRFDYVETSGNIFRRKSEGAGVPNLAIDRLNSVANSGIRIWHSISELNRGNLVDRNSIR
jgi:hypothetical protein